MNNDIEYRICSGAEVYKKSECEGKDFKDWPPITDPNGIKERDRVYTCIFGAYVEGIVKHDGESFFVDTPSNITNLFYAENDADLVG